jgi:hypothetical protein
MDQLIANVLSLVLLVLARFVIARSWPLEDGHTSQD